MSSKKINIVLVLPTDLQETVSSSLILNNKHVNEVFTFESLVKAEKFVELNSNVILIISTDRYRKIKEFLKQINSTRIVPSIVISKYLDPVLMTEVFRSGATDYILTFDAKFHERLIQSYRSIQTYIIRKGKLEVMLRRKKKLLVKIWLYFSVMLIIILFTLITKILY